MRLYQDVLNRATEGIPTEKIRYHVCWGSWPGPHTTDVPLKDIMDLILRVRAGAYVMERANPRHEHEWQVWKDVKLPKGSVLIPGVISHATNVVEHPELVKERIVRLAKLVGRENVIAGTDCGFAQQPFYQRVHPTHSVGEAADAGRGRAARQQGIVGQRQEKGRSEEEGGAEARGEGREAKARGLARVAGRLSAYQTPLDTQQPLFWWLRAPRSSAGRDLSPPEGCRTSAGMPSTGNAPCWR